MKKTYKYKDKIVSKKFWFDRLKNASRTIEGLKRKLSIIKQTGRYRVWSIV
tara:strand:- start:206 stop:358 length:153 start_codon:yes stop_codon:yes gene_type:complete